MMQTSLLVVRGPVGVGKSSVSSRLRDLVPACSLVEPDAIKRMIDPSGSSDWRRTVAHDSTAYIIEQLLRVPRTVVVEAHTKYPAELDRFAEIAERAPAQLVNILLTAPLEVCQERAAGRHVPGITYAIDEAMVRAYYCNMDPRPDDLVFDTVVMDPDAIARAVIAGMGC